MFLLTILEKIKEARIFSRKPKSLIKDRILSRIARVKLAKTKVNTLKSAAKSNAGTMLSITKKNVRTTRQKFNIRNSIANNLAVDIKLSKAQIYKITQPGGFLGSWLNRLGKNLVIDLAVRFARDKLSGLVSNIASNAASNAINKFER